MDTKNVHTLTRMLILLWVLLRVMFLTRPLQRFFQRLKHLQGQTRNILLIVHIYSKINIFARIFNGLKLWWLFFRHKVWGIIFVFHPGKHSVFQPLFRWLRGIRRFLKLQFRKILQRFFSHLVQIARRMSREMDAAEEAREKAGDRRDRYRNSQRAQQQEYLEAVIRMSLDHLTRELHEMYKRWFRIPLVDYDLFSFEEDISSFQKRRAKERNKST